MNTPETDKKSTGITGFYSCETVPASFARKLEIERDTAQREAARLKSERNEARDMLRKAGTNLGHGYECRGALRPHDCRCGYMGLLYAVENFSLPNV
jgi:hypothetical protein